MNCNQARALLAAYRELKNEEVDAIELDVHLEECASCRQELARSLFISEKIRSLPVIETPPDMHAKFMRALAQQQVEFIRRSAPGTVLTPEFLKPYLLEHAQSTHRSDLIAAFSTAETGPLPLIQAKRKPRPRPPMNQFAVIGLAATFLMLLMMGGITSLLLLSHNNLQGNATNIIANKLPLQAAVEQVKYITSTPYQHVVSAVADRADIYYTAYANGANNPWMLESLDRTTKISTPLLATASAYPLIVLGSSNSGLVWLELDESTPITHKNPPGYNQRTSWSLHYLSFGQQQQAALGSPAGSEVLLTGTFDQSKVPAWVTTPVQGIWFVQNSLLVATIDAKGISHLIRYQLDATSKPVATEIATAAPGHVLTSPTANGDGTQIYWSDEWLSNTGILYSNIWTQQVFNATHRSYWQWPGQTVKVTLKVQFTSDGMSFRPQVVDNTLFFLRAARQVNSTQATPTTTATATPVPATTPDTATISRTETSIYAAPLDASVRGTMLRLPLDSNPMVLTTSADNVGLGSSLQAGTGFALWQTDKGYAMYDEQLQSPVTVGETLSGASFVAVNGTTAVWMINDKTNTTSTIIPTVTLMAFNWPK